MVYDCFTFFNELDLLEIRLNELNGVVDRFVIVESNRTFTNRPKAMIFAENRARFASFIDKIIYVPVTDHPPFKTAWHYECHQRNAIARGLTDIADNDRILIGDVDEIPSSQAIRDSLKIQGMAAFQQTYFAYYLNFQNVRKRNWRGTKMVSGADFKHGFDGVAVFQNEFMPPEMNEGTTPSKIRWRNLPRKKGGTHVVKNGGWHFTSMGGSEKLKEKMLSFSHQEYNPGESKIDSEKLQKIIERGEGPFWKMNCFAVPLDNSFPSYLRDNQERYAHLLFAITPEYMKRVRWNRFWRTLQGRWIQFAEWVCPAAFHNWLHLVKRHLLGQA